jgi:hypothetical protein
LTFFKYDRCFNTFETLKQKNSTLKRGMLFTHARTTKKIDEEKKIDEHEHSAQAAAAVAAALPF